ncbi:hypothetical protein BO94DRAFT_546388 [Aspergillus sclerotioniger CBS 115572]|uniref:Uncharacterized protein n=1 Tax=Aspergillus sclerotioniger CBS 115572 TaxID=1450535 RepID=A0A317WQF7_9EURO|nr:hypothetical protein BO94DRAFT_546388 [Aspergillus sclerotioniger CBS 115572]PWY87158.1 hypothetical protein BO94DRAFT_546388 [Aspergillus sclerotioniger CBS 115572]
MSAPANCHREEEAWLTTLSWDAAIVARLLDTTVLAWMAVDNPRNAFPRRGHHHSTAARPSDWLWIDKTLVRRTGLVPTSSSSLCEDAGAGWVANVPGIALPRAINGCTFTSPRPPTLHLHFPNRAKVFPNIQSAWEWQLIRARQRPAIGRRGYVVITAGLHCGEHASVAIVSPTTSKAFALQHPRTAVVPGDTPGGALAIGLPRRQVEERKVLAGPKLALGTSGSLPVQDQGHRSNPEGPPVQVDRDVGVAGMRCSLPSHHHHHHHNFPDPVGLALGCRPEI